MTSVSENPDAVEQLLDTPDLATALESEQFKKFLDQVPIAIAVSDLSGSERVVYANPEFEKLSGLEAAKLTRENWGALLGSAFASRRVARWPKLLWREPISSALSGWNVMARRHRLLMCIQTS